MMQKTSLTTGPLRCFPTVHFPKERNWPTSYVALCDVPVCA